MFLQVFCFAFSYRSDFTSVFSKQLTRPCVPSGWHHLSLVYGRVFSSLVSYQLSNLISVSWLEFVKATVPASY